MSLTYTPLEDLGSALPEFELTAVDGSHFSTHTVSKVLVVLFICNHCPYVQAIEQRLIRLVKQLPQAQFLGICSNDPSEYPEDSPKELYQRWKDLNYGFPYLIDERQEVAKKMGAVCTPDIFVYDQNKVLKYRGRFDDSWKDEKKVQKSELKLAIEAILAHQNPMPPQRPSMGCSIKWKASLDS